MSTVVFTIEALMDALTPMTRQATVVTDCGCGICTLAPERDTTSDQAQVVALALATADNKAPTVAEMLAMFAYYNVRTPRRADGRSPSRTSRIILRPMGCHERIITGAHETPDHVMLTTEPLA